MISRRVTILVLVLGVFSGVIFSQEISLETIEAETLASIQLYAEVIDETCQFYSIDPGLAWGVLYTEKVQYELDEWLKLRRGLESALDSDHPFLVNLRRWANLSVGFTHLKPSFVAQTYTLAQELSVPLPFESYEFEPEYYSNDPATAIRIMILSFRVFIDQWKHHRDLSNRPDIVATLYNLGYEKSFPHPHPQSGGSVYPTIVNGRLYEGLDFGTRVKMVIDANF